MTKLVTRRRIAALGAALALWAAADGTACAGPLSLERFFDGRLVAKGQVENLREGGTRSFTMEMAARWDGPVGTLVEDLAYADGERQHKVWTFTRLGPGRFVGRRADLTRDAEVVEDEAGVRMSYKANTRVPSGSTWNLAFEDRLTPLGPDSVAMRSDVSYLFLPAARVTMTITRLPAR